MGFIESQSDSIQKCRLSPVLGTQHLITNHVESSSHVKGIVHSMLAFLSIWGNMQIPRKLLLTTIWLSFIPVSAALRSWPVICKVSPKKQGLHAKCSCFCYSN